jgi:hypothetical protein
MALFSQCMPWCARKGLDTADIVIALGKSLEEEEPKMKRVISSRPPANLFLGHLADLAQPGLHDRRPTGPTLNLL